MKKGKKALCLLMVAVLTVLTIPTLPLPASAAMPPYYSGESFEYEFFYIENAETGNFMQMDDNDAPNYNTAGAFMELWDYHGRDMQRWGILSRGNGYYQIFNVQSGWTLAVQDGYENRSGKALVQEQYVGDPRQLWSITMTSRGTCVLRPYSSEDYSKDWCMSAGASLFGISDGLNVEQREYDDDSSLKDEWILHQICDVSLLGLNENSTVDRSVYFSSTRSTFASIGRDSFHTEYFTDYTKDDMIRCMQRSIIFYIHTHGDQDAFYIDTEGVWLTMEDLEDVDLTQLDFALLLTCWTAEGGYDPARVAAKTPINMLEQLICCGVETAIGFSNYTYDFECNWFAQAFSEFWVNGNGAQIYDVNAAVRACALNPYYTEFLELAEIGGDGAKTIS